MDPGKGPVFPSPLTSPTDMDARLTFAPDVGARLGYMFDAIHRTRREAAAIHAVRRGEGGERGPPRRRFVRKGG